MPPFDLDRIAPASRQCLDLPIGALPDRTPISMRIEVLQGAEPGPALFLSGCIHGDELNGFEIIRRVIDSLDPSTMRGLIMAVPIVNVFGFLREQRYLPDRRDLNRSFPGSARGSQASRLAHDVMEHLVRHCDFGIDLHTGPISRFNAPQIRGDFGDPTLQRLAHEFCAPFGLHSAPREGTIRKAAAATGTPVLLFEGGEALRFDRRSIQVGVDGTLRVLKALSMIDDAPAPQETMVVPRSTRWIRARHAGVLRLRKESGEPVHQHEVLGSIGDALADETFLVKAPVAGRIISHATGPIVSEGDAVLRIAEL